jgi:hypothetical protein
MTTLNKESFIEHALQNGWHKDKYGHLQKTINGKEYRYKIGANSVRLEKRLTFDDGHNEWIRILSQYYKHLYVSPDNKILGFER